MNSRTRSTGKTTWPSVRGNFGARVTTHGEAAGPSDGRHGQPMNSSPWPSETGAAVSNHQVLPVDLVDALARSLAAALVAQFKADQVKATERMDESPAGVTHRRLRLVRQHTGRGECSR